MVDIDPTPLHGPGSEPVTDTNFATRLAWTAGSFSDFSPQVGLLRD